MGIRVKLAQAAQLVGRHDRVVRWHVIERKDLPAVKEGRAYFIDVDDLERVPGWRVDPLRLAQLTHSAAHDAGGTLAAEVLARHVAKLEQELAALRARLAVLEGRSAAAPPTGVSPQRSTAATSETNLATIGADADYHRHPAFPLSANPVQHRPVRRVRTTASVAEPPLPEGWRPAIEVVMSFGVPQTTARRWVEAMDKYGRQTTRKLPAPHHGAWASGGPGTFVITSAYDEEQQRQVAELVPRLLGQRERSRVSGDPAVAAEIPPHELAAVRATSTSPERDAGE